MGKSRNRLPACPPRSWLAAAALAAFFLLPATAAQAGEKRAMTIYQLTWQGDNVEGEIFVNDFPVNSFDGTQAFGGAPLNPYLVRNNEVRVEVRKKITTKRGYLKIGLSAMAQGEIAASDQSGNLLTAEIKDPELQPAAAVKKSVTFRSYLDFSNHLCPETALTATQAIEYARTVYRLFEAKRIEELMKEFEVKISDYGVAYPGHDFKREFRSALTDMLRGKLAQIDFKQVRARKCGPGGKLWQLLEGRKQLIRTAAADGSENEMALYVGLIDGKPRIVR